MKTVIEMAREAGFFLFPEDCEETMQEFYKFAELVRADEREQGQRWFDAVTAQHKQEILAEREACAKVCDDLALPPDVARSDASIWEVATLDCAEAIRARSNT